MIRKSSPCFDLIARRGGEGVRRGRKVERDENERLGTIRG